MEVVSYAKGEEPDDGAGNSQIDHGNDKQPVEEYEADGDVVPLNHGSDRERPGDEEEDA